MVLRATTMSEFQVRRLCKKITQRNSGKNSAQRHTTLCIQFLDREKNDKNNKLTVGEQICFTIVRGYAEILPNFHYEVIDSFWAEIRATGKN